MAKASRRHPTYEDVQNCRRNITQSALLFLYLFCLLLLGASRLGLSSALGPVLLEFELSAARENERHLVSGVCGVWRAGLSVDHLLGVAVVGGDGQDVPCLLACFGNDADCLVRGGNGFDGGFVNTSVANLADTSIRGFRWVII